MFELLITIFVCWLLLRWLLPRVPDVPVYFGPPAPQIVIHVEKANVLIQPSQPSQERQEKFRCIDDRGE